jgi:hypothetical protein
MKFNICVVGRHFCISRCQRGHVVFGATYLGQYRAHGDAIPGHDYFDGTHGIGCGCGVDAIDCTLHSGGQICRGHFARSGIASWTTPTCQERTTAEEEKCKDNGEQHMDTGEGGEDVGKEDGAEDEEDGVDLPSAGLWKSFPPTDNQT